MTNKTTKPHRSIRYAQRQQAQGLFKAQVWIPESKRRELSQIAEQWRNEHKSTQTEG